MRSRIVLICFALLASGPAAADAGGPAISDLRVRPGAGPPGTVYTLSLRIAAPEGPDGVAPRLHQVREGIESISVLLNDEGRDGDRVRGDGIYSGQSTVPETAAPQRHRFEVFIRDKTGRKSNVLIYFFTVLEGVNV